MKKTTFLLASLLAVSLNFISCTKEEAAATAASDTTSVGASASIETANTIDIETGLQINTSGSINKKTTAAATTCAVISVDNATTYPKVFTVDYGTGCTIGLITRKGQLKITITAPLNETGSKMTIERIDYSINGMKLGGTIDYTNTTSNAQVPQWLRSVNNGTFTNLSGKVFKNTGSYVVQQTEGVSTPYDLTDNVYEMIQGQHTVTNDAGNTLTLTVQETLVKKYSCQYISKGKLKIDGSLLNGVIDYGNNDCDSNYTYTTQNGKVYALTM